MRINPRLSRRIGLALALTGGTLAAAAPAALAAPAISATPFSGLANTGTTDITVSGTGFTTDALDQGRGLYAAVTATVSNTVYVNYASTQIIATNGPVRLSAEGRFTARVPVTRTFSGRDAANNSLDIDCAVTQCSIRTWTAQTAPDDTTTYATQAIRFSPQTPRTVTVTPSSGLSRTETTTVTVNGSGFAPSAAGGRGLYVAYGPKVPGYWRDDSAYGTFKFLSIGLPTTGATGPVNADGTFTTTLDLRPVYTGRDGKTYDCRAIECGILTMAAHGGVSPEFDTTTPLTFAPPKVEVSPATNLNRDAATAVTVRGSEFATDTYVAVTAIVDGAVVTDPANSKYVYSGATPRSNTDVLNADGTFTTTLNVTPTFTTDRSVVVDCRVTTCAISTWRTRTLPTPTTLWTSQPLAFAAAVVPPPVDRREPVVTPPPVTPAVTAPKASNVKGAQKLDKNGVATVGTIAVGSQDATLKPFKLTLKIGKKRYAATVVVPKSVKAGKKATVKVKLSKKAIVALKGRSLKVTVKVKVTAGGKATTVSTKATLKGAAKK